MKMKKRAVLRISKKINAKSLTIVLLLSVFILNCATSSAVAEETDFPDRVYLFSAPSEQYTFSLYLEKNHKYRFYLTLYTPDSEVILQCYMNGPDSDGDGDDDFYHLAGGELDTDVEVEVNFLFGPAETAVYNYTVTGTSTENVNVHIKVEEKGVCFTSDSAVQRSVDGYYNQKKRTKYFPLESDNEYRLNVMRTNTITDKNLYLRVTVCLFDDLNNQFFLIDDVIIHQGFNTFQANFGTARAGQYRMEVVISTDIPTVNMMTEILHVDEIGDGQDDDGADDEDELNDHEKNSQPIQVDVPVHIFLTIGVIAISVFLIAYTLSGGLSFRSKKRA